MRTSIRLWSQATHSVATQNIWIIHNKRWVYLLFFLYFNNQWHVPCSILNTLSAYFYIIRKYRVNFTFVKVYKCPSFKHVYVQSVAKLLDSTAKTEEGGSSNIDSTANNWTFCGEEQNLSQQLQRWIESFQSWCARQWRVRSAT